MATARMALHPNATTLQQLDDHLKEWFYQPDLEALRVTLSVAASHYSPGDPTWLFVEAPPATGKTSVNIQSLITAPSAHLIGDLTPQTFLSGKFKRKGGTEPSLLSRVGSGILLFKDFTTIISKRPDDRVMIVAQLREIYDGTFIKDTGDSGRLEWRGKMTVIAAVTPAIQREWMILRDLGERFMTVRWNREQGVPASRFTLRQRSNEKEIGLKTAKLGSELMRNLPTSRPPLTEEAENRILNLAELVAHGRNKVVRDGHSNREIIDVPQPEGPNRIAKALASVVSNHAALFHREVCHEDIKMAVRLATNSIPTKRYQILCHIPPNAPIDSRELEKMAKMPHSSFEWQLDELAALDMVSIIQKGDERLISFSDYIGPIWQEAFPSTV